MAEGLIDLESGGTPAAEPEPAPAPGTLPDHDEDIEQAAVEVPATAIAPKPEKVVPIGAVKQERQARRQLASELKTAQEQLAQFQQFQSQATPILQALQSRPDIIAMLQGQPAPQAQPTQPTEDTEAKGYAELLGMYDASGNLDTTRARKALDVAAQIADKKAEARIAPVQQQTIQQRAVANYQWALAAKDDKGRAYADPATLNAVLSQMPAEMMADQSIVQQALIYARGLKPAAMPVDVPEPLYSEAPGGRLPHAPAPIDAVQRAAMQAIGADEKTWTKMTANLDKYAGRAVPLE